VPLLDEKVTATSRTILAEMREPVRMTCFTSAGCHACGPAVELAREVAALSPQLRLEVKDIAADAAEAARLGVERTPTLALAREGDARTPVRYAGLPAGHEFGAFLRTLLLLSTGTGLAGIDAAAVAPIVRPAALMVFVLAGCTRCAAMAWLCNSIAAASELVTVEIVDADAFPDLVARHRVGTVPVVVINGAASVVDVVPPPALIARIAGA
jgi:alkyl hydroperoxide reductase subunit AhpF